MIVLLGADYCGKSSVMRALAGQPGWSPVSCDDEFLPDAYRSVSRLRHVFFESVLPQVKAMVTPDFALLGLQMSTAYLRDWAGSVRRRGAALVDSYYYKVLAKCLCSDWHSREAFAAWRSYPRPDEVLYLSVDPNLALTRARALGGPNPFEHSSHTRLEADQRFIEFQTLLAQVMHEEIAGTPTTMIDANRSLGEVIQDVRSHLAKRYSP